MSNETFEFSRAKWATDVISYPAIICQQPKGHVISFIFQSSWGGSSVEIQKTQIQDQDGKIVDTLISDKWYLNPDLFPDSISFPLSYPYRPSFILIQNGLGPKGIRKLSVMYDEEQVWCGEVPMGSQENCIFPIAVPVKPKEQKEFMKFLSQKLAMEVIHRPETSASEFFNSVIETFPKKVKRGPRIPKTEEQTENARSHKRKDGKQEHLTDFQIFKNAQLELRADEFKGLSPKTKNQMLTHEWYALTDDQKQEVLKNNGHLSYFL